MKPESFWKPDAGVEAARKRPGWIEFHKACAEHRLFYDHIEKDGRQYACDVFTGSGIETRKMGTGRGKTVIDALVDAYRVSGRHYPEADAELARLTGETDEYLELIE